MTESGIRPDISTFNSMINSLKEEPDKMVKFLLSFKQWGLKPDRYTFMTILDAFDRIGEREKRSQQLVKFLEQSKQHDAIEEFEIAQRMYKPFNHMMRAPKTPVVAPYNPHRDKQLDPAAGKALIESISKLLKAAVNSEKNKANPQAQHTSQKT